MNLKVGERVFLPSRNGKSALYTGIVTSVSDSGVVVKSDDGNSYFAKSGTVKRVSEANMGKSLTIEDGQITIKGKKGDKGDKGEKGDRGERGPEGKVGATGKQ